MTDESIKQDQPTDTKMLGQQGNTGEYGQGQYDSEGKPDMHGKQAQRLHPTQPQQFKENQPNSNTQKPDTLNQ